MGKKWGIRAGKSARPPIENLVLHYNLNKESYDGYLIQYDLTPEEYIITGLGAALPILRKIPISFVGRGARLEKMVLEVFKLGVPG